MGIAKTLTAFTLAATMLLPVAAHADKFQDIMNSGEIRVGILLDVPPYGMTDENGKATGMDVEVAELMAKELSVNLQIVPVTGTNRIPNLLSDQVDVLIAAMAATSERGQQIMFSQPYAVVPLAVYGKPEIGLSTDVASLDGYSIAVARGTTLDLWLTDNVPAGTKIARFEDVPSVIAAYQAGQVDLLAENGAIISSLRQDRPEIELAPVFQIRQSALHAGVGMGEHNLLQWVNTFVFANILNGNLPALQEKWLQSERTALPGL